MVSVIRRATRADLPALGRLGAMLVRTHHEFDPNRFFAERFIANYCPLVFMEASGKNRTPDKLPPREREPLYAACDAHLGALVRALEPEWVIGVGKFAEERAQSALAGSRVQIGTILHPSPASPLANRGWADQADQQLMQLGLRL